MTLLFKWKIFLQREIDQKLEEFKQKLSGKSVQQNISLGDNNSDGGFINDTHVPVSHGSVQFTPAPQVRGQQQVKLVGF